MKEKAAERKRSRLRQRARNSSVMRTVLIKDATDGIAPIKDEASATAALPKLQDITAKLGALQSQRAELPQPLQKTVGDALRPLITKLREAAQPVLALPVVGDQVKPGVDELLAQLAKLLPERLRRRRRPCEVGSGGDGPSRPRGRLP